MSQLTMSIETLPFLQQCFPTPLRELDDKAFIEVRILGDVERHKCYGQKWYESIEALVDDLDSLNRIAAEKKACIAFSPALRKTRSGKKDAFLGTWCLWNDQNLKSCGQQECIDALCNDKLSFTVVNSGNCAHGYLLLDEMCQDIETVERANRLLKKCYGGDNIQDAGRLLRLPGTMNYKNPDDPKSCHVIQLAEKKYSIGELIDQLEYEEASSDDENDLNQRDLLVPTVKLAVEYDPLLQRLTPEAASLVFETIPVGDRSEHDLTVTNRLVGAGLDDGEIKSVFARYPCGEKARENGFDKYLQRTIGKARLNGHLFLPGKSDVPATPEQLRHRIGEIRSFEKTAPARQEATARLVVNFFDAHGKFFTDGLSKTFVCYEGETLDISDNRRFRSLLQFVTALSLENKDGKLALDHLANHAVRHGQVAHARGPVFCDRRKNRIFVYSGSGRDQIIRVSENQVDVVANGTNEDRVCLAPPEEFRPFEYQHDVGIHQAIQLYESKLIGHLACDDVDRQTILLWLPNVFLLNYSTTKIVMKLSGAQSSGKTVASRLIGLMIAGEDILKSRATGPAIHADPMPLQILDNVENRDLRRAYEDLIIFAATGGNRQKMRLNCDNQRMRTELNCLLLLNAIESLDRSEILSRIFEIDFNEKHQADDFLESSAIDELLAARSTILSGLLKMMADYVLPRFAAGGIAEWKKYLDREYKDHPKRRSFEFLSRMGILAEATHHYANRDLDDDAVLKAAQSQIAQILHRQASSATEADAETNVLANHIHGLVQERVNWDVHRGSFLSQYHLEIRCDNDVAKFQATARELLVALSVISKKSGLRGLEIRNPRSLGARLLSDQAALVRSGIAVTVVGRKNNTNVYEIAVTRGDS